MSLFKYFELEKQLLDVRAAGLAAGVSIEEIEDIISDDMDLVWKNLSVEDRDVLRKLADDKRNKLDQM